MRAACVHAARLVQVAGERVCRVVAVSVADVRYTLALIAPVQGEGEDACIKARVRDPGLLVSGTLTPDYLQRVGASPQPLRRLASTWP